MDAEGLTNDVLEHKKLEEIRRRVYEVDKHKNPQFALSPDKEAHRYEELIRNKSRQRTTKEVVFNNAFCVEIKQEEERIMHILKSPGPKLEGACFDQIFEKERKGRRDENRVAQDRLKTIERKSRYADAYREVLSPVTRARNAGEIEGIIRSSSKKETLKIDDRESVKILEGSKRFEEELTGKRFKPRSLSRRELSPYNIRMEIRRSPIPRKTLSPIKK